MHERALMRDVLRKVEEVAVEGGAARVTRVEVRVGELSHLTPDGFREHFADAARGTVAEGAQVEATAAAGSRDVVLERVEIEAA